MHVNEDVGADTKPSEFDSAGRKRRSLVGAIAAGHGSAAFCGPSNEDCACCPPAQKKPLIVGLTMDVS